MKKEQKKEQRGRDSTRQLMGIDRLTEHGVKTANGELVFFFLRPDNLSILSSEGVRGRVLALTNLLSASTEACLMALDSRESFEGNKDWYRQRLEDEQISPIRGLLQKDMDHLDSIQAATASSREFLLAFPLGRKSGEDGQIISLEQRIRDSGFHAHLAGPQDVKRILAVYYRQDVFTEHFADYDGERWMPAPAKVKKKATQKKKGKRNAQKLTPVRKTPQKDFLDLIAPTTVKFDVDHYIVGDSYRCVMAVNGYPTSSEELALLRHLGDKSGVTLKIYARKIPQAEENTILQNASSKIRMERSNTNDLTQSIKAQANYDDMTNMIYNRNRDSEPLNCCAVFIELAAKSMEALRLLRDEVQAELGRAKISVDRLTLRQREGFLTVNPAGHNEFRSQFERVLPTSSVANLYPNNYSGKTDPRGFYVGRDKYGSNIIVDLDRRAEDKTTASALILGNSGQGKSFLLKLLVCNILESGKSVICMDPEHEMVELCEKMGGCFIDLMGGRYLINPLEPKVWDVGGEEDKEAPAAFRQRSKLSQHISFLKDFFRCYKDFADQHIDVIELMLERLYAVWDMTNYTDFSALTHTDYPTLSDLYDVIEDAYENFGSEENPLYPRVLLREVLLGLRSMCKGSDSKFFNGHTNVTSSRFLVFGVKGLMDSRGGLKNALLFNTLSYLSDKLLTEGSTAAVLDELYLFLTIPIAIEYIRSFMKRVRKKNSSVLLSSQNLEDFTQPGLAELTRPLFSIPTHQFLFNGGSVDQKFYMDNLQLTSSEFDLIRYPEQGTCLYKCGNERYQLMVKAPEYKRVLFGTAGGQ